MIRGSESLSLCLLPISITFVFLGCRIILFCDAHVLRLFKLFCSFELISVIDWLETQREVSSTYMYVWHSVLMVGRSFTKVMNSIGPKHDPWGIPEFTGAGSEVQFSMDTTCVLSFR